MIGTFAGCCARAASGHAAAAPRSAMKSRRLMGLTPRPRITELSIVGVGVGQGARIAIKGGAR